MSTTVKAFGAESATTDLVPLTIERRAPLDNDVSINIIYCGVCHSDLHQARGDWGENLYPVIPGHEIVGEVSAVGPKVTKFKVGDKVGVGCMVDSCLSCKACSRNLEQYCSGVTFTYNSDDQHFAGKKTYGGCSQSVVVREEFVLRMPDGLDLAAAAPLLCAGITMWSPLVHYKAPKLVLSASATWAHALGAEVTLFSRTPGKEEEAKAMGAHKIVISTDKAHMDAVEGYFDIIIDTVPVEHELTPYVNCLDLDGALVMVGLIGPVADKINTYPLIFGRKIITGSGIGGIKETQEMLDFCGKHNIVSEIEKISIKDINAAYKRIEKSDVRYRFVIDSSTL